MEEIFDKWNEVKKIVQNDEKIRLFKQRDIFFINMGQNVGFEQNGKGENFVRPIIILKKITNQMFIGIPLSSQLKKGDWFFEFEFNCKDNLSHNIAIIPQIKMFSSRRLLNKIGVMKIEDFDILKQKVKDFIDWFRHFVRYEVWPEGNYEEIITRCWNHVNITNRIIKAIKYLEIFIDFLKLLLLIHHINNNRKQKQHSNSA